MNYLLNTRQALRYLSISEAMLHDLIMRDGLPVVRLGTELRFRTTDLNAWIESRTTTAGRDPGVQGLVDQALARLDIEEDLPEQAPATLPIHDPYIFFVNNGELILKILAAGEAELAEPEITGLMQALDIPGNHGVLFRKAVLLAGGQCALCPRPPVLDNQLRIVVTPDRLHAFAFIPVNTDEMLDAGSAALLECIRQHGVVHGLDTLCIQHASHPGARGRLLHVSRGTPPRSHTEPEVVIHLDVPRNFNPKILESPEFDTNRYRSRFNATRDQILAEVILPRDLRNGIDVFAEPIPYDNNVARLIKGGPNTYLSQNGLRLHAARDGIAYWKKDAICVDSTRFLEAVGYDTGNVDFDGRVIVQGNVVKGFRVTARRGIIIKEQVEQDVRLESGSSIRVAQGIRGGDATCITAAASVFSGFAERCEILSGHNISIASSIVRARLKAAKSITMSDPESRVVASKLEAGQSIRISSAGSRNQEPVLLKIELPTDDLAGSERLALLSLIDKLRNEIKYSKTRIRRFKEQGSAAIVKEQSHLASLGKLLEKEENALKRFLSWVADRNTIFIDITGAVFPGVMLQIEDKMLEIHAPGRSLRFFYSEHGLQSIPL